MAAEGDAQKEIGSHLKSYDRFIAMMKWGGAISLIIALLWIIFIGQ
jgi:hypothetical protein